MFWKNLNGVKWILNENDNESGTMTRKSGEMANFVLYTKKRKRFFEEWNTILSFVYRQRQKKNEKKLFTTLPFLYFYFHLNIIFVPSSLRLE